MPAAVGGDTHPGREVEVELGQLGVQLGSWRGGGGRQVQGVKGCVASTRL